MSFGKTPLNIKYRRKFRNINRSKLIKQLELKSKKTLELLKIRKPSN
jgi:hypothetical protein